MHKEIKKQNNNHCNLFRIGVIFKYNFFFALLIFICLFSCDVFSQRSAGRESSGKTKTILNEALPSAKKVFRRAEQNVAAVQAVEGAVEQATPFIEKAVPIVNKGFRIAKKIWKFFLKIHRQ